MLSVSVNHQQFNSSCKSHSDTMRKCALLRLYWEHCSCAAPLLVAAPSKPNKAGNLLGEVGRAQWGQEEKEKVMRQQGGGWANWLQEGHRFSSSNSLEIQVSFLDPILWPSSLPSCTSSGPSRPLIIVVAYLQEREWMFPYTEEILIILCHSVIALVLFLGCFSFSGLPSEPPRAQWLGCPPISFFIRVRSTYMNKIFTENVKRNLIRYYLPQTTLSW